MRPTLVLMLVLAGVAGAIGFPLLFTGSWMVGGGMACASVGCAMYALRKSQEEAEHQRAYDHAYRERIDAYAEQVRLDHFNSWRHP